jgi:hypothetical protein
MYVFFAGWLLLLRGYAGQGVYGSGSPIMYGLGWVVTCGVWMGAYWGTITESINSGLLLYGKGALGIGYYI